MRRHFLSLSLVIMLIIFCLNLSFADTNDKSSFSYSNNQQPNFLDAFKRFCGFNNISAGTVLDCQSDDNFKINLFDISSVPGQISPYSINTSIDSHFSYYNDTSLYLFLGISACPDNSVDFIFCDSLSSNESFTNSSSAQFVNSGKSYLACNFQY